MSESKKKMIALLCTSRSGSSMITGIFAAHGLELGEVRNSGPYKSLENIVLRDHVRELSVRGKNKFLEYIPALGGTKELVEQLGVDLFKCSVECWKPFEPFSTAVKIKRNIKNAAESVTKRGVDRDYDEAVKIIEKRYQMLDSIPGPTIHTDKVMAGDYSELKAAFDYCGLVFDADLAKSCIDPTLWHHWA